MTDRLLDAAEIAELLHVPETWVRQETRGGRMPYIALGRYRRYDREAVLQWVDDLKAGGNGVAAYRRHRPQGVA